MAGELDVIQNYLDRMPARGLLAPQQAMPQAMPQPIAAVQAPAPAYTPPPAPITFTPPAYVPSPRGGLDASFNPPAYAAPSRGGLDASFNPPRAATRAPEERGYPDYQPPTQPTAPPRPNEGVDASFLHLPDTSVGYPWPSGVLPPELMPSAGLLGPLAAAPRTPRPDETQNRDLIPSWDPMKVLDRFMPGVFPWGDSAGGVSAGLPGGGGSGSIPPFWMPPRLPGGGGATFLPGALRALPGALRMLPMLPPP
jgi:hypothetical protein